MTSLNLGDRDGVASQDIRKFTRSISAFQLILTSFGAGLYSCLAVPFFSANDRNIGFQWPVIFTEMSVHRNSITPKLFLDGRNEFGQLILKHVQSEKNVTVREGCWTRQDQSIWMKDPKSTSDFHMVKLIQMPTLRFVVFFFWQNLLLKLYPSRIVRRATGSRDITGSGYPRQLSSRWRLKYQHKAGGNKRSPIANINKERDCVHS